MAITVLNVGSTDDGAGDTCLWSVDYDSISETVGATITTTGTCTQAILELLIPSRGKDYLLDCLGGPAGNITNQGRVVLGGPGSVIGDTTPLPPGSFPLPPFGKGVAPPYEIDFRWHQ